MHTILRPAVFVGMGAGDRAAAYIYSLLFGIR